MKNLSDRERFLIVVALTLAMVGGFWFLVRGPLIEERQRLSRELDQKRAKLEEYRQLAAQRERLEREYRALQDRIQAIEAKLPPKREIPQLLRQMQAVAAETRVKLILLRPGPLETPRAAGSPTPAPQAQPAQQRPPADVPYELFRLDLAFEGSYDTVMAFLRRLENFPRFIAMTSVNLTVVDLPRLRLGVVSNTFVLPDNVSP
jgi:Tfp pilus assembly protein PilO